MDNSFYTSVNILQIVIPCKYPIILSKQKVKNDKLAKSVGNI